LDEINVSYQIATAPPPPIEVAPGGVALVEKLLDDVGLQYTARRVEDQGGIVRKCAISMPAQIPAGVAFQADYRTGAVRVSLLNVDRLDRVSLEFQSRAIDEPMLEDLVRLILGRSDAFLHRAPLVGVHGRPSGPERAIQQALSKGDGDRTGGGDTVVRLVQLDADFGVVGACEEVVGADRRHSRNRHHERARR